MSFEEKNKEAIGWCLYQITELRETVKEQQREINRLNEKIVNHINEL